MARVPREIVPGQRLTGLSEEATETRRKAIIRHLTDELEAAEERARNIITRLDAAFQAAAADLLTHREASPLDHPNGSVTAAKLSSGAAANGHVLTANGSGGVSFLALPGSGVVGAMVRRPASTLVPSVTDTPVQFTVETADPEGWHDLVTNPSRVTVDRAGWFHISASNDWDSDTSGTRYTHIRVNGTDYMGTVVAQAFGDLRQSTSVAAYLSAGDYVEMVVFQVSGGAVYLDSAILTVVAMG